MCVCVYLALIISIMQVQESKRSTGRVVVYKEFQVLHSYTLEASFSGLSIGPHKVSLRRLLVAEFVADTLFTLFAGSPPQLDSLGKYGERAV